MQLCQVTPQGALPLNAIPQGLHQETSDRFVSERLLSVILRHAPTSRVIGHLPYSIRNYPATFASAVKIGFWRKLSANHKALIFKKYQYV